MMVSIHHPDASVKTLDGFKYFWAKSVTGFNPTKHCMDCLIGVRHKRAHPNMLCGPGQAFSPDVPLGADLYICGVATPPEGERDDYAHNFHLVCRHKKGSTVKKTTYNGYVMIVTNAEEIPIPAIRNGWRGLPYLFTRCRNFQYGVLRFGYPAGSAVVRPTEWGQVPTPPEALDLQLAFPAFPTLASPPDPEVKR